MVNPETPNVALKREAYKKVFSDLKELQANPAGYSAYEPKTHASEDSSSEDRGGV
jgi:hypothetical protein